MHPRLRVALAAGAAVAGVQRLTRRRGDGIHGRGTVISTVDPKAISRLARGREVVLVSGTNGKTTTTHLIAALHEGDVATNATGANMRSGVTAALVDSDARVAVLEVDELYLAQIIRETQCRVVVLLNLSRDQLDRSHEVDRIADAWAAVLRECDVTVVANAADPHVVYAAPAGRTIWFDPGTTWREDARVCPACGELITWNDSGWRCACGLTMPVADYAVRGGTVRTPDGGTHALGLALPGDVNAGNAVAALAVAGLRGLDTSLSLRRLAAVRSVAGRYRSVDIDGRAGRLLLAKNPAGWASTLTMVGDESVVIGINAREPDGRDTSWLYDVPFEVFAGRRVGVTGERRDDLALRLHIAGAEPVVGTDLATICGQLQEGPVTLVGNYTCFMEWHRQLRGGP